MRPRRTLGWRRGLAIGLVSFGAATAAHANGRPPAINGIAFDPRAPERVALAGTFGLLLSRDCGGSWRWVCEQAVGYNGVWDPKFVFSSESSALFGSTFGGLAVSRDDGCTWASVPSLAGHYVEDLQLSHERDPSGTRRQILWATTGSLARRNCVYASRDDGRTFAETGLCSDFLFFKSLATVPDQPEVLYATGYDSRNGLQRPTFHRSLGRDPMGELRFEQLELPDTRLREPRLVGVDPANPRRIYLWARDIDHVLLTSADAGTTWTAVTPPATSRIQDARLVGSAVLVATNRAVVRSDDAGASWQDLSTTPFVYCLGQGGGELYGCTMPSQAPHAGIVRSSDGRSWTPFFKLENLLGPLGCAPDSVTTTTCAPLYPGLASQLIPEGVQPRPGPGCAGGPADGGMDGAVAVDASSIDAMREQPDSGTGSQAAPAPRSPGGCGGCAGAPVDPKPRAWWLLLLLLSACRALRARAGCAPVALRRGSRRSLPGRRAGDRTSRRSRGARSG